VAVQSVNQTLADSFQLDKPEGALISGIEPGGPAEKAGLRVGDVVQRLGGKPAAGLALRLLSPDEQRRAGTTGGLLVKRVQRGPATLAGLQRGDVLLAINSAQVNDLAQLQAAVATRRSQSLC
jgi:S1-C subfamily serine protease